MKFEIIGKSIESKEWESVDQTETRKEAKELLTEYIMAFQGSMELKIKRI